MGNSSKNFAFRIAVVAGVLLGLAVPVFATSNYQYGPREYALVRGGMSGDKKRSLRAHGQGDLGDDNFQVFVFNEATHRRGSPLVGISPLDTSPGSFTAHWAPGSQALAISFRSDRRILTTAAYRLTGDRADPIDGPSIFERATNLKEQFLADNQVAATTRWAWKSPTLFKIDISQTYRDTSGSLLSSFGGYGKRIEVGQGDDPAIVQFSAKAECELVGDTYRIISLRPGKFDR